MVTLPKVGKVTLKSLLGHFNDLGVLGSVGASADHKEMYGKEAVPSGGSRATVWNIAEICDGSFGPEQKIRPPLRGSPSQPASSRILVIVVDPGTSH